MNEFHNFYYSSAIPIWQTEIKKREHALRAFPLKIFLLLLRFTGCYFTTPEPTAFLPSPPPSLETASTLTGRVFVRFIFVPFNPMEVAGAIAMKHLPKTDTGITVPALPPTEAPPVRVLKVAKLAMAVEIPPPLLFASDPLTAPRPISGSNRTTSSTPLKYFWT